MIWTNKPLRITIHHYQTADYLLSAIKDNDIDVHIQ